MKRRVNKSQSNHNNIKINTNSININFNNNKKQCPICTKYFDNNEISDHMYAHEVEDDFKKSYNNISLIRNNDNNKNNDDKGKKKLLRIKKKN